MYLEYYKDKFINLNKVITIVVAEKSTHYYLENHDFVSGIPPEFENVNAFKLWLTTL